MLKKIKDFFKPLEFGRIDLGYWLYDEYDPKTDITISMDRAFSTIQKGNWVLIEYVFIDDRDV